MGRPPESWTQGSALHFLSSPSITVSKAFLLCGETNTAKQCKDHMTVVMREAQRDHSFTEMGLWCYIYCRFYFFYSAYEKYQIPWCYLITFDINRTNEDSTRFDVNPHNEWVNFWDLRTVPSAHTRFPVGLLIAFCFCCFGMSEVLGTKQVSKAVLKRKAHRPYAHKQAHSFTRSFDTIGKCFV